MNLVGFSSQRSVGVSSELIGKHSDEVSAVVFWTATMCPQFTGYMFLVASTECVPVPFKVIGVSCQQNI